MTILSGVKVLEIAGLGPAPWCATLLADMGASIIRIERPAVEGDAKAPEATERGRTVLRLDLKQPAQAAQARDLAARADVLIEGMRSGAMERLDLGPQDCLAANPKLVYARMTGWGQDGPLASRAGHDINYIALTGALHAIGRHGQPPAVPLNLVADYGGGGAFMAIGILAALLRSRESGHGQVLDIAMIDGVANLMNLHYSRFAAGQWCDERGANMLDSGAPWYDVYRTRDGGYMAVGAIEPQFYGALLRGLGLDEAAMPDRRDRANWSRLRECFSAAFLQRSRAEWTALFEPTDACVTPVLSLAEAPHHSHNLARATFVPAFDAPGAAMLPNVAPRFCATPSRVAPRSIAPQETFAVWGLPPEWQDRVEPLA